MVSNLTFCIRNTFLHFIVLLTETSIIRDTGVQLVETSGSISTSE